VARAVGAYIYKCLLPPDVPINDGLYRAINVIAPRGTVLNSTYPVGLVGTGEVSTKALETAFRAFAQALPKRIAAMSKACICNVAFGGVDPRSGEHYVFYETIAGGYGGRFMKDGVDGVQMHWQNTENSPIEELEVNYPVLILRYELIQDSEGAGRYRGGLGIRRDYLFKDHAASFSILSDTAKFPPLGLFGGLPARPLKVIMKPESPDSKELGSKVTVNLESNGVMSVQTPGGGGYGPPLDRDPEMVLKDVRLEKISLRKALEAYGVVIDQNGRGINYEATAELRSKLKVGASG